MKFWSLAYLGEEESGYGWVGQEKEDMPQIFIFLTNSLKHILNNYSQFTYAKTDLLS